VIRIQIETLYLLDRRGRLLRVNEPDGGPAPRFFLGRTADGNAWSVGARVDEACAAELARLAATEPVASDFSAEPRCAAAVRDLLAPIGREWRGPAYLLPRLAFEPESAEVPSRCYSSRVGERADEAGVETPTEHRGRGYAPIAVAAWARRVQAEGRLALYSTSWENRASQRVAEKLRGRLYGEDWHVD
jgi:RimJ/RimL family protein N-acetyltransferase